jgi:hypothetical protein
MGAKRVFGEFLGGLFSYERVSKRLGQVVVEEYYRRVEASFLRGRPYLLVSRDWGELLFAPVIREDGSYDFPYHLVSLRDHRAFSEGRRPPLRGEETHAYAALLISEHLADSDIGTSLFLMLRPVTYLI